jgi:hypothetical protein
MKLYQDILAAAWHKTIHQPALWFFGLFAAFVFGNAGELDRYLRFMNSIVTTGNILNPRFWQEHRWSEFVSKAISQVATGDMAAIVLLVSLTVAGVLVLIMMCIAVGALIKAAAQQRISFQAAFSAGAKHWPQLLILFVVAYGFVVLMTTIVGAWIFKLNVPVETAQQTFVLVGSLLFVPLVIVVSFIVRFTAQGIVTQNLHLVQALRQALQLLRRSWLVTLEMAIVNFVLVVLVNLILVVSVGLLFAPQYATALGLQTATSLDRFYSAVVVSSLVYAVLVVFVGAILSTWQWIAWTLLFERLRTEQPASTLLHWLHYRRQCPAIAINKK